MNLCSCQCPVQLGSTCPLGPQCSKACSLRRRASALSQPLIISPSACARCREAALPPTGCCGGPQVPRAHRPAQHVCCVSTGAPGGWRAVCRRLASQHTVPHVYTHLVSFPGRGFAGWQRHHRCWMACAEHAYSTHLNCVSAALCVVVRLRYSRAGWPAV